MSSITYGHDGSVWRKAKQIYGHDGTAWRKAKKIYAYDGSNWQLVHKIGEWVKVGTLAYPSKVLNYNGNLYVAHDYPSLQGRTPEIYYWNGLSFSLDRSFSIFENSRIVSNGGIIGYLGDDINWDYYPNRFLHWKIGTTWFDTAHQYPSAGGLVGYGNGIIYGSSQSFQWRNSGGFGTLPALPANCWGLDGNTAYPWCKNFLDNTIYELSGGTTWLARTGALATEIKFVTKYNVFPYGAGANGKLYQINGMAIVDTGYTIMPESGVCDHIGNMVFIDTDGNVIELSGTTFDATKYTSAPTGANSIVSISNELYVGTQDGVYKYVP